MMGTDKTVLAKGLKYLLYTTGLMFTAPVVMYQAFKNEGHPFFWPVLVVGLILGISAIALGFYSIKTLMDGFFGTKK